MSEYNAETLTTNVESNPTTPGSAIISTVTSLIYTLMEAVESA